MQDSKFIHTSLERAFWHPLISPDDGVQILDYLELADILSFANDTQLPIYDAVQTSEKIQKYTSMLAHTVNPRTNHLLYTEYETFKHDIAENIVVPENYPETAAFRQKYDLSSVNRQSAQKKKIAATIFPAKFTIKFKELRHLHSLAMQKAYDVLSSNPEVADLALIINFSELYKFYGQRIRSNMFLRLNYKRLRFYINEAAQLLKSKVEVSDDFVESHVFWGERFSCCKYRIRQMRSYFLALLKILRLMAHNPQLLSLVQALLANEETFNQKLKSFRNTVSNTNLSAILSLYRNMQNLFDKYAHLVYLNGVRNAFEHNLDDCPEPRHPPLPTVSPQDELKKIAKIIEDSNKIEATPGKLRRAYLQAFKEYRSAHEKLATIINKIS